MTKEPLTVRTTYPPGASDFFRHSSFVIRHFDFRRFHQLFEQPIHLAPCLLIEPESDRAADNGVLENALAQKQMFFDGEEGIEAGLNGDECGEWFVDPLCLRGIAGLQRAPESHQRANQVRTWHGANHAVWV